MDKSNTYRALDGGHVMTAAETDPMNKSSAARWRNRMCCLCFERGTVIVKGHLYCRDHAPEEGASR